VAVLVVLVIIIMVLLVEGIEEDEITNSMNLGLAYQGSRDHIS
jgi:hypothetical protein